MRKSMQGKISLILVLLLLIPSLVMAGANIDVDYIQDVNNVLVNIKGVRNRPVSISIKDQSRYHYINQGTTDDFGKVEFKTELDVDKTYDCKVNIDGETVVKKIVMEKSNVNPEPSKPDTVSINIRGYEGTILNQSDVKILKDDTVLSLTTRILDENNISYINRDGYIASINGQKEFDKGPDSGWMYSVNGKFPNLGAGSTSIKDGDKIEWKYTYDLGEDIGAPIEDDKDDSISDILDSASNTLNQKNVTEKEISKEINNITKYIEKELANIKPEKTEKVLADGTKVSQILLTALEKAETESLIEEIGKNSIEIAKNFGKIIDDIKEQSFIEDIGTITRENMGIALESANKLNNKNKLKIIDNMIETSSNIESKISKKTLKANKISENIVSIKAIEKQEDNNIILPKILLEKAIDKDIDKLNISSNMAEFSIGPDFLGNKLQDDLNININQQANVLSLQIQSRDKVITEFENPIKIKLPFNKPIKNKDNITVILIKEDGTKESIGGIYNESTKTVNFLMNQSGRFTIEERNKYFKDTSSHKWAEEAIESMGVKGIINGRTEDKFDPEANITRAEFATLVSRMLKYNEKTVKEIPFKDVNPDEYYYNSISAIYENGLINGKTETTFDPEGSITRQEMTKVIGNILKDNSYKKQDKKELDKFNDNKSIATWAEEGAAIVVHNEIIIGNNGKFLPEDKATRAETAVILHRLYELIMD